MTGGSSPDWRTIGTLWESSCDLASLPGLEGLDDGELHSELDQVEGEEPNNVPNPDDTNPSTGDSLNVGETPVTEGGNNGGDELSQAEREHQSYGWSLSEAESVGSGDEDEGLGDDSDLEIDDHVDLWVVDTLVSSDVELALEEGSVVDDDEEDDAVKRKEGQGF